MGTRARGILALVMALSAITACSESEQQAEAPDQRGLQLLPMAIHGMPVVGVRDGPEAQKLLRDLHGQSVAPLASYIGQYRGGGAAATLYISRFPRSVLADSLSRAMSRSIQLGRGPFSHDARFTVEGVEVHAVTGEGRAHFFYARGPDLVWLAIDPHMARVGLASILGTGMEHIPVGIRVGDTDVLPPPDSLYRRNPATPPGGS